MEDIRKVSLLSAFIKQKISDKGWSIKKFAEEADLSNSYAYELVAETRKKTPTNETLNKIADVLELSDKDRKYILDIAGREREIGQIIYEELPPSPPSPHPPHPPEPHPDPQPPEPVSHPDPQPPSPQPPEPVSHPDPQPPSPQPPEPVSHPDPQPPSPQSPEPVSHPDPQPPSPHPPEPPPAPPHPPAPSPGQVEVSWSHKKVVLALIVGLIGGLLVGCCSASALIPLVCQYLNIHF